MLMRFAIFAIVSIIVLGIPAAYLCWRLLGPARLERRWRNLLVAGVIVSILITPVTIFFRHAGMENTSLDILAWTGYTVLGFMSLVFTFTVIRDIGLLAARIPGGLVKAVRYKKRSAAGKPPANPDRRRFLQNSSNIGILMGAGLFAGYGMAEAKGIPAVNRVRIPFKGLPPGLDGFRIVQISDIHVSPTTKRPFVQGVVNVVNSLSPDLVALTGDLVDGSVERLGPDVAPLADIAAPYGNFFVTGNHEYYSGALPWIDEIRRLGFTVLMNEHHLLTRNDGRLLVAGVTDYRAGNFFADHRSDPHKALSGAPNADVKLLLAHQPRSIFAAAAAGFDLQLSGHTHGGQFFPWNYVVFLTQPYVTGLHQHENTRIYISSGTGYWGPPLRIGSPAEITLIELTTA